MVLLSETFFAVIAVGSVVHVAPSTLYSILTAPPLLSMAVAVPALYVLPSYFFTTSVVVSVMLLISLDGLIFSQPSVYLIVILL